MKLRGRVSQSMARQRKLGTGTGMDVGVWEFVGVGVWGFGCIFGRPEPYVVRAELSICASIREIDAKCSGMF